MSSNRGPSVRSWRTTQGPPALAEPLLKDAKPQSFMWVKVLAAVIAAVALITFAALAAKGLFFTGIERWSADTANELRTDAGRAQVIGSDGPRDADGVSHSFWSLKPSVSAPTHRVY